MSAPKKDSVEMESIIEHTYNGGSYKPGDTFSVEGDGGAWSAEMMADSLTAIGHAVRTTKKVKKSDMPSEEPKKSAPVEPMGTSDLKAAAESKHIEHRKQDVKTVKK
jgi:hypothetical protein